MATINNAIINGMINANAAFFSDSPVVVNISGLKWPDGSTSFTVVNLRVMYGGKTVGEFSADTAGQASASFDISSALRSIWSEYTVCDSDFLSAISQHQTLVKTRNLRKYSLMVWKQYVNSEGEVTTDSELTVDGGYCTIGRMTELERHGHTNGLTVSDTPINIRYGGASSKPTSSPERVGSESATSYVEFAAPISEQNIPARLNQYYYPASATQQEDTGSAHAPIVARDSVPYVDFLFVNRRGAVETCSGRMLESMSIEVEQKQYTKIERPSFSPTRSLMSIGSGGRRSWAMSSGYQEREWAEWWVQEFLMARQWWMLYNGAYVPVEVKPSKSSIDIYDRSKQKMPHIDFTVTLSLEG